MLALVTDASMVSLVVLMVTALAYLLKNVRAVTHILMDVISHFYRRSFKVPSPFGELGRLDIGVFVVQQQIEARMRRVLQEVKTFGNITHLTVVSHSQGTVIAADVLWYEWTNDLLQGAHVRLVTMGSPLTHLYQHYFPRRYPPMFDAKGNFVKNDWGSLFTTVNEWINIYRVDDFVGTYIKGGTKNGAPWPDNRPVVEKRYHGHNNYWSQPKVLAMMLPYLPG